MTRTTSATSFFRTLPLAACATLSLLGASNAAFAQAAPALDRFSIAAGGFYVEPKVKVDAETQYGNVRTPEGEADHTTLPRVKAEMLIGDSHGLSLDYFRYHKSYSPEYAGSAVVDGQTVTGSASGSAKLELDLAKLAYKFWMGRGNDVFGVGLGAAYYRAAYDGRGTATATTSAGVSETVDFSGHDSESAFAPLVELAWRHQFSPQLRMVAEASGIKKNGGRINGHIYGGSLGLEWYPVQNVGLMVDYGTQKISLNRDAERDASLDVRLTGPSAYLKVRF
ncbi:hypothetical protein [uncultured Massilia sp.]|uniref:hypothetical protein n=1 Tax=uncultured Massilia sp. TaxID=169973 RepID=UPI0025F830B6|nr:hypothetical protein [uncultured Massilia sp.]